MREEIVKIYKFDELSETAKERARNKYRDNNYEIVWQDEILDSFKAVFQYSGIKIVDYELGLNYYSYVKIDLDENTAELSGARAMAWLENNLLNKLRIPFKGKSRWDLSKYGPDYRPGKIKPCPFTGFCADDDFLEALISDVKGGNSLKDCYMWLVNKYVAILEAENEYQNSDEYIDDHFSANDYEFTEDGSLYY